MRAALDDRAILQNNDAIGIDDGRTGDCDDQRGTATSGVPAGLLNEGLVLGIDGADRAFVE